MLYVVFVFWCLTSCWTGERCTLVMWCEVFNIVFISVVELDKHLSWCVLTERSAVGVLTLNCEKSRLCLNLQRETEKRWQYTKKLNLKKMVKLTKALRCHTQKLVFSHTKFQHTSRWCIYSRSCNPRVACIDTEPWCSCGRHGFESS